MEKNKITIDIISEGPYDVQKVWAAAKKNSGGKSWLSFLVIKNYLDDTDAARSLRSMIDLSFGEVSSGYIKTPQEYGHSSKDTGFARNAEETPNGILLCDADSLMETVKMRAGRNVFEDVTLDRFVNVLSKDPAYFNARAFQVDPSITTFKDLHRMDAFHINYGIQNGNMSQFNINHTKVKKYLKNNLVTI